MCKQSIQRALLGIAASFGHSQEWARGPFRKHGSKDPPLQNAFGRRAVRSSRFGNGSGAEETREPEALRLPWRRGRGVSRGVQPRGGRVLCACHRISTETGYRARSHIRECKTPESSLATLGPRPDWHECLARTRKV